MEFIFYNIPEYKEKIIPDLSGRYSDPFTLTSDLSRCHEALYCVDNGIKEILLLEKVDSAVHVATLFVKYDKPFLQLLRKNIFSRYEDVNEIKIFSSQLCQNQTTYAIRELCCVLHRTKNDAVIHLPETIAAYDALLGGTTRRHTKNYISRLRRDFPDNTVRFVYPEDEDFEELLKEIARLHLSRMKNKGNEPTLTDGQIKNLLHTGREFGVLSILAVGSTVIAGCISFVCGETAWLSVIGHDDRYGKYSAGHVCLYKTVEYFIQNKKKEYHLLWGKSAYKYRFCAEDDTLYDFVLYRDLPGYVQNLCGVVLRDLITDSIRYTKMTLKKTVPGIYSAVKRLIK